MIIIFTTHVTTPTKLLYYIVVTIILLSECYFLLPSLGSSLNLKLLKTRTLCLNVGFCCGTLEWCYLQRNGGKPVHKGCHQMTQWPQPCANRVPATSLRAHTRTWLMCCLLFSCRGRSAWPRLTTPKELWLLWILSSCNITWNVSHAVLLAIIMIATFCLGTVNYVSMSCCFSSCYENGSEGLFFFLIDLFTGNEKLRG